MWGWGIGGFWGGRCTASTRIGVCCTYKYNSAFSRHSTTIRRVSMHYQRLQYIIPAGWPEGLPYIRKKKKIKKTVRQHHVAGRENLVFLAINSKSTSKRYTLALPVYRSGQKDTCATCHSHTGIYHITTIDGMNPSHHAWQASLHLHRCSLDHIPFSKRWDPNACSTFLKSLGFLGGAGVAVGGAGMGGVRGRDRGPKLSSDVRMFRSTHILRSYVLYIIPCHHEDQDQGDHGHNYGNY